MGTELQQISEQIKEEDFKKIKKADKDSDDSVMEEEHQDVVDRLDFENPEIFNIVDRQ